MKELDFIENIPKPEITYEPPDIDALLLLQKVKSLEDRITKLEDLVSCLTQLY